MRIAYLTQSYPPMVSGASIAAEQLAKAMAKRGHEVLVIAASDTGNQYLVKKKNLTIVKLKSIRNPLRVNQRSLLFPKSRILQALQKFQPDLIHTHEPLQVGLSGLSYAESTHIPIVLTTHQLPWFVASYIPDVVGLRNFVEKLVWRYARWIIKKFSCVISPTKTITRIIQTKTNLKPITINYGIDLQLFSPCHHPAEKEETRLQFNIPRSSQIILHIGRLDVDKSVDRMIFASEKLLKNSKTRLLIVGDGSQRDALQKLCVSLGIENQVCFAGFISCKGELAKIYRASDIFVTASEIETQGIVILEAMACGLPIAAVKATCIPEVVKDGVNGYLAKSGDKSGLSEAINQILKNRQCVKSMKTHSRLIAEKYSIESSFAKHEKLYIRLLKSIQ